jgi:LacI family transcriptional regulator
MSRKRVTIRDVAEHAGVSIATVSHVINKTRTVSEELQQRVQQVMDELGYRPNAIARGLRTSKTQTIGLIVPNNANPFYAEIAHGVEVVCFSAGYSVVLCNSDRDIEKEITYSELLLNKRADGIIFAGAWVGDQLDHIRGIVEGGIPVVAVDRFLPGIMADSVVANNIDGGRLATRHLVSLGHSKIACIRGFPENTPNAERVKGYLEILSESGIEIVDDYVRKADFQVEGGYQAAKELLDSSDRPTSIFACNDLMAIGAMRGALDLNLQVPEDISIVGFDNLPLTRFLEIPLTTIDHKMLELGSVSANLLLDRMNNPDSDPVREVIDVDLIVRSSTATKRD